MQNVVKTDAKDLVECEHVLVETVESSMNIPSSTDDHEKKHADYFAVYIPQIVADRARVYLMPGTKE